MGRLPLVLIGGTLCDARLWSPLLSGWQDCDVITVTPGEGSEAKAMPAYAAEVLKQLPTHFYLAGFSLGGLVAMEIIAQAPHRVDALALISAGAGPEPNDGAETRRAGEAAARHKGMRAHVRDDLVPRYAIQNNSTDVISTLTVMAEALGQGLYGRQNDLAISRVDSRPRLSGIDCPVLLATGSDDPLCPPSRHAEIAPLLRTVRLFEIPECGHLLPLERPTILQELLSEFVQLSPR